MCNLCVSESEIWPLISSYLDGFSSVKGVRMCVCESERERAWPPRFDETWNGYVGRLSVKRTRFSRGSAGSLHLVARLKNADLPWS